MLVWILLSEDVILKKVIAIHQPNYIPWLGYFHKMAHADIFVLLDNVQFPKGGYGNRVKIKGRVNSDFWLTVPVRLSKSSTQMYNEIEIAYDQKWQARHVNLIRDAYQKTPFFSDYFNDFKNIIRESYTDLADLNITFIEHLKHLLGIETRLEVASKLDITPSNKNERNLEICKRLNADIYLSGQGARKYNDHALFARNNIQIEYNKFRCPRYAQMHGDFIPNLSVIDLIFNCGPESKNILLRS